MSTSRWSRSGSETLQAESTREDPPLTPARYFLAAAIVLLLGATAMPVAAGAYALSSTSREPYAVAMGVWASFVIFVALGGPVILTIAGILSLFLRRDDG